MLGGVLVTHAGLAIARAFPDDVRANAVAAVKRRPRLVAVGAGAALWTLVYALYSLAYPNRAAILQSGTTEVEAAAAFQSEDQDAAPAPDNRELLAPSLGGEAALPTEPTVTLTPEPTPDPVAAPAPSNNPEPTPPPSSPPTTAPPPPPSEPEPEPCPAQAIADTFGPGAGEILCPEGSAP